MRKIKKGIRTDLDSIAHTPKEKTLESAGVSLPEKQEKYRPSPTKLIPIMIAAAILLSWGAMLTLAEDGDVFIQIQNIFIQEEEKKEHVTVERRGTWNNEFHVLLNDRYESAVYYYRSVKDIVAEIGEDLYYPSYLPYENAFYSQVMRTEEGSVQIEYPLEKLEIFWIKSGVNFTGESMNPHAEQYESHGTVFYIGEYREEGPNGFGGHYAEGILEGNSYSFFTTDKEKAKLIIDSLTKAE